MDVAINGIYYKEIPLVTGNMVETTIAAYSPKHKTYQKIRNRQLKRAKKMINSSRKIRAKKSK